MAAAESYASETEPFISQPICTNSMVSARSGRCGRFRGRVFILYNYGLYYRRDVHGVADRRVQSLDVQKGASLSASAPYH